MHQPLPCYFYDRPTTLVAQELLGKFLIRHFADGLFVGKIVETEAYLGTNDAAAHSAVGRTKRTQILFGEPGRAYVYQLRNYYLLNAVTEGIDTPTCVLFRALEPMQGIDLICKPDNLRATKETHLLNGPGKLCRALEINLSHYGMDLSCADSPFYIANGPQDHFEIEATTRIGISKAVEPLLRFTIKGNPYLSR
ncbi:MAG: DNA-3-methyladenine glycosylase [Caldilineaceae bacterium]|nr:DNA-3-methyladenine glycosylase [Caldilineaceae bacterium]